MFGRTRRTASQVSCGRPSNCFELDAADGLKVECTKAGRLFALIDFRPAQFSFAEKPAYVEFMRLGGVTFWH